MNVQYDLVIDFARPSKSNTIIISEGDTNSRLCRFILLGNKQPFSMLGVTQAHVLAVRPDGTTLSDDATISTDSEGNYINELTYTFPVQLGQLAGKYTLTITLASGTGEKITSFEFYVVTRNALYSEDDYIEDTDLKGFQDILNQTRTALKKMEAMTENDALPNPYALNLTLDGVETTYAGAAEKNVDFGYLARINQDETAETEDSVDTSAAKTAVDAANRAAVSEANALTSETNAATSATNAEASATSATTAATNCGNYASSALASANLAQSIATSIEATGIVTKLNNLFPAYSSGSTYNANDLVMYGNALWKCLATTTNAPSEGTEWTRTSAAAILTALLNG